MSMNTSGTVAENKPVPDFIIEADKTYRREDGAKIVARRRYGNPAWPITCTEGGFYDWNGLSSVSGKSLIAEWTEPATPDADGWIEWHGGECPVPGDTVVEVRGDRPGASKAQAGHFNWTTNIATPIRAYRVVKQDAAPLPPPAPDAQGWITWAGGACPVLPSLFVDFKDQRGEVHEYVLASNVDWPRTAMNVYQPHAYRLHVAAPLPITMEPDSALDVQVGGDHYRSMKIQPIEYIHANNIPFAEGTVIKYVSRHRAKGGIADLEKARHVLDLLIELERKRAE